MNPAFWNGRRVLITGHTGFKGGWLALWLQQLGARVTGFALAPETQPNFFDLAQVGSGMTSIIGDVRQYGDLCLALASGSPQTVFHLAAQPLVRRSYIEPVETYATNVMGTVHLLEAAAQTPSVETIVLITSDKCYENQEWVHPYRESDPLGGYDPYSNSKGCAELVAAAYRSSFFSGGGRLVSLATARAGNVIGGGDWSCDRLVPDCIRSHFQGQPLNLRYPQAIRPWQHVLEPLAGYLQLAEALTGEYRESFAGAWNFGPEPADHVAVNQVVAQVSMLLGGDMMPLPPAGEMAHEAGLLRLDTSKAQQQLAWRPRWRLDRALAETVAWYQAWQRGEDLRRFSEDQIKSYLQGDEQQCRASLIFEN